MSNKPNQNKVEKPTSDRRRFFQLGIKALSGLAVAELAAAGLLFLRARSLEGEFGGIMTLGKVEDFTPNSVVEYEEGNFFLVCEDDGGFLAVYRRCPHLGCTIKWVAAEDKFHCPCHAATFDKHGEFNNQIVSRALDTFPVIFEDGMVKVDTSLIQVREHHTQADISYRQ